MQNKSSVHFVPWIRVTLGALLFVPCAFAHDSGLNHSYRTIFIGQDSDGIILEYRVNMPPDEAWLDMARMDTNRDGQIDAGEKASRLQARSQQILQNLQLTRAGKTIHLTILNAELDSALTQTFTFRADAIPPLVLQDENFIDLAGTLRIQHDDTTTVTTKNPQNMTHVEAVTLNIERNHPLETPQSTP